MRIPVLAVVIAMLFMSAYNSCGPNPPSAVLAWGVLDKSTNVNSQHVNGDNVQIVPGDTYIVTLQVQDPESIKEMDVVGNGQFTCTTQNSNGQTFTAPDPLSASIPIVTTQIPNSGSTSGFMMSKPFVYSQLDCGRHQYANMTQPAEFFATSGTLKIQGTDISWKGSTRAATLNLGP